jgi:hypothetical protein
MECHSGTSGPVWPRGATGIGLRSAPARRRESMQGMHPIAVWDETEQADGGRSVAVTQQGLLDSRLCPSHVLLLLFVLLLSLVACTHVEL